MVVEQITNPQQLYQRIREINETVELNLVQKAYEFAISSHGDQKRLSGEPYIVHPLNVAYIVSELRMDITAIVSSLLHDVVEDTKVTSQELIAMFGQDVERVVNGVTKISSLKEKTKEINQAANIRKIILASIDDMRVMIVKLADKLHNMRTLQYQPEYKQKRIAQEVLDIYAPIAGRLGMYQIKSELEDLALKYANPKVYKEIAHELSTRKIEREQYINNIKKILDEKLSLINIHANIQGRAKHLYSIYAKMKRDGKDLNQIYDLHGIRIITDNLKDCYSVLGIIHTLWNPLPGRFKDYIAIPKTNMYQSIHTTVWGPGMAPLEVQIRSDEMDRIAERGVAAHWMYKETGRPSGNWFKNLQRWHSGIHDNINFLKQIKNDLAQEDIYVFSPKGEIIELPDGSTPIDFAYHIHTEIGNRCSGAKVNGKIVNLRYTLQRGDQIEILVKKNSEPNASWLKLCKTNHARSKIRLYLRKKEESANLRSKKNDAVSTINEDSGITLPNVLRIKRGQRKVTKGKLDQKKDSLFNVEVMGQKDIMIHFPKCCMPVVGDQIIGFVSKGRGITVHRKDCHNVKNKYLDHNRLIDVIWESQGESYPVAINIIGTDRDFFLRDLVAVISNNKVAIISAIAKKIKHGNAKIHFSLGIVHKEELTNVLSDIRAVLGVKKVYRV